MNQPKTVAKTECCETIRNHYETLNVSPNATLGQIEKSYQKLSLKWHPDKHTADRKVAQRRFQQISEAFDVLSDPNKRSTYDQMLSNQWSLQSANKTFDQFFNRNHMVSQEEQKFFQKNFPQKRSRNYYKILQIPRYATMQEIGDSYRRLALMYHPRNNPNNEQAKRKFLQISEAYQTLSNMKKKCAYDDMVFGGQCIPKSAHDMFQEYFQNRWMDLPSEADFFKPIFGRRSRLSERSRHMTSLMEPQKMLGQLQNIKDGQSYYRQEKYEKKGGKSNHIAQTVKKRISNGIVQQETLKENILPNGERDVVKILKKGQKVDTKTYHLGKNEKLPKQITNF